MSADDLEQYEAELRLQLYREYRDVTGMFRYVVETERGVYLANAVERHTDDGGAAGRPRIVLDLHDAWVWDMYRQQRFVPHVQIVTFRDVVIEELARDELDLGREGFAVAPSDPSTDQSTEGATIEPAPGQPVSDDRVPDEPAPDERTGES